MNEKTKYYVLEYDKESKKLINCRIYNTDRLEKEMVDLINEWNEEEKNKYTVELIKDPKIIELIELKDNRKINYENEFNNVMRAIDDLQSEITDLFYRYNKDKEQ